jgi:hypothetical protein
MSAAPRSPGGANGTVHGVVQGAPGGLPRLLRAAVAAAFVLAAVFVAAASVIGTVRLHSAIPFWDAWDGIVDFYLRVRDGDGSAWWAQHNEHRVGISRLFFWADLRWFGGGGVLPITLNFAQVALTAWLFWRMLREQTGTPRATPAEWVLGSTLAAWLSLWVQQENLTSPFQVQFILTFVLPLAALYALHRAASVPGARGRFALACGLGAASLGTMANGILALPAMTVHALLTRQGARRVAALAALSVAVAAIYLHGYQRPPAQGSMLSAMRDSPLGLVRYVLLYLGGPFYHLAGRPAVGLPLAYVAGGVFVAATLRVTLAALRAQGAGQAGSLRWALLAFIGYVGATAVVTAGGRLLLGVEQALAWRYATPALMAWAALIVLLVPPRLARAGARLRPALVLPCALALAVMVWAQAPVLRVPREGAAMRSIGALAMALDVRDPKFLGLLYPDPVRVLSLGRRLVDAELSVFGAEPFTGMRRRFGQTAAPAASRVCIGLVDAAERIDGEPRFVRVGGWIFDARDGVLPRSVDLADGEGRVIGQALTGLRRAEAEAQAGRPARYAGFQGYLPIGQVGEVVVLGAPGLACRLEARVVLR